MSISSPPPPWPCAHHSVWLRPVSLSWYGADASLHALPDLDCPSQHCPSASPQDDCSCGHRFPPRGLFPSSVRDVFRWQLQLGPGCRPFLLCQQTGAQGGQLRGGEPRGGCPQGDGDLGVVRSTPVAAWRGWRQAAAGRLSTPLFIYSSSKHLLGLLCAWPVLSTQDAALNQAG